MECCVVAAGAEVFGVDWEFSFASATGFDFWFVFEGFVAGVTEAFGVVFFFGFAINADFYHHEPKKAFVY